MFRKLAWIVLIAATAAAGGCLSGSGAVRGETVDGTASAPVAASPSPSVR